MVESYDCFRYFLRKGWLKSVKDLQLLDNVRECDKRFEGGNKSNVSKK